VKTAFACVYVWKLCQEWSLRSQMWETAFALSWSFKNSDPSYIAYQSNIEVKLSYKMSFFHYLRYNFSSPYVARWSSNTFWVFEGPPYHISKEVKSCIFRWWWIITYTLNPKPLTPPNGLLFHGFFNLIFAIQIINQVLFFTCFWNFTFRAFFPLMKHILFYR
jgi:hypothetical protein